MNVRKVGASVLALATMFGGIGLLAPTASAGDLGVDATAPVAFGGSAYGSEVKIAGPLINSDKTAFLTIGCTRKTPITKSNSSAAVEIDGVADVGAVTTDGTTRASEASTVFTVKTQSHVENASVLPGLIEVGAIETEARAFFDADGYHAATDFSIASLSIGGDTIVIDPDGNQVINIVGVGSLTLGESKVKERANFSSASVTAVVLRLTGGTVVRIGHSQARVDNATNALFGGGAYGTTVEVGGTIESGKTANQPIGCVGTHGKLKTNETAGVDLGGLGTASAVRSDVRTRQGTPPDSFPEAHAANTIESVTLLSGLTLTGIKARANALGDANGDVNVNTNGTGLGSITLGILNIPVPAPGGFVDIVGIGTLYFYEVDERADGRGIAVTAVRLVLLDETEIVISHAEARIR